jgi:hypothetical protein
MRMSIRSDFRATNRTAGKAAGAALILAQNLGGLLLLIAP